MWVHTLDPTIVSFGSLEIRYYGLVYVLGFLLGIFWLLYYRRELAMEKDDVYDLMFYVMLGIVIGSRLFYALFWNLNYFLSAPWKVLFLWEGGMAFHGGLVGALVAGFWYCHKKNVSFLKVADILSVPAVLTLALGRIANFINGEIVGRVTDVSWCVNFGDGLCRHPYQLYSAAKRFVIAGILFTLLRTQKYTDGFVFWSMILLMGTGRFFLDFFREDMLYYSLSIGQWMSLVMALVACSVLLARYRNDLQRLF